ncbi:MAG: LytTR family transcriptional regulator DNA-binding domain-containing protein, partial [Clostridia bacterium]|nr:LytTR family transcriptional regulator DNA-binding domain-containing protein [Clostridia bacterium]
YRIYAEQQKVLAVTEKGVFQIRMRLYQLEEKLAGRKFVRISNSEIINLKKTAKFDLSIAGTIQVRLKNGQSTYVSRRYVSKIKEILGI